MDEKTNLGVEELKQSNDEYDFQGIDRLINGMLGLEWRLVVICESVPKKEILNIREGVYDLYNRLSMYSKSTLQHAKNASGTIQRGECIL